MKVPVVIAGIREVDFVSHAAKSSLSAPGWLATLDIDLFAFPSDNPDMKTTEKKTDKDSLLEHLTTGKPLDPEAYRRIREKGERISEELLRQYGQMDIAVELIREVRDEA